jgi:RNA polymerase sigma factor (sigma-70 family)
MQSVNSEQNNKRFEEAINNDYYKKIMHKVCNENLKGMATKDEIKSLIMNTLWNCIQKFDDQKKVKFSSYLYRSIQNNSRRIYKSKAKEFRNIEYIENYHSIPDNDFKNKQEVRDILMSVVDLNPELHNILVQKFYYNMTNKEIGEANGYGKEAARKKLKKAIELCRELCIV